MAGAGGGDRRHLHHRDRVLANIVLPDNTTAGEWMLPQIDRAYRTGEMPPMLPAAGNSDRRSTGPIPLPPA